MKLDELPFPTDLYYLVEYDVWARLEADGTATVGITALGIKLSGEIYMCRAKPVDTVVTQGRSIAVVELAKAIVSVKSAVTGTVLAVNPLLDDAPQRVHTDPYGEGWIARLALADFERDLAQLARGEGVLSLMARHAEAFRELP
ncbi:MAG: glycine cleavage system protein H [Rhizobacter sp.]|nr:glycine cleavage system protein H [Rhizobacter sp.]